MREDGACSKCRENYAVCSGLCHDCLDEINPICNEPTSENEMTKAGEAAKLAGLKSLSELADISGESVQTLNNWYKNESRRFELVLKGAVFEKTVERVNTATD